MIKKNFADCHVRVFDVDGLIYQASPDMDAYELTHKILDLQRNQTAADPAKQLEIEILEFFKDQYIKEWIDDVELYSQDRKLAELEEIAAGLRNLYSESFLIEYLNLATPTPHIGNDVSEDILRIKILLRSMGLHKYIGELQAYNNETIYTESIDNQGVIVKVSHWQTDEKQVFAFPENVTFQSVIENITVLNESYEAESERLERAEPDNNQIRIYLNDLGRAGLSMEFPAGANYDDISEDIRALVQKYVDADGIIKPKQCVNCRSMNTISAGSGAGCCNECGSWIPDYNYGKRLIDPDAPTEPPVDEYDREIYLRGLMAVYPQGESFDDMVADFKVDPEATTQRIQKTFDRLLETLDQDYIYAHSRVDSDMPDPAGDIDHGIIIDFVEMKIATYALGYNIYIGSGCFL